jgi:DNA-binding response OmpR family regulator
MGANNLNFKFKDILIVEDDEALCHLYTDFFIEENIKVDLAHSVKDAEVLCAKNKYDLAIIDWNLKGHSASTLLNGSTFKVYFNKPILIITGYSDHEDFDRDLLEKYNVLYKPFTMNMFKNILIDLD